MKATTIQSQSLISAACSRRKTGGRLNAVFYALRPSAFAATGTGLFPIFIQKDDIPMKPKYQYHDEKG